MNQDEFPPVSPEALKSFKEHSPDIIKNTVNISMKRSDEVDQHGDQARELLTIGMEFTTRMLESAMSLGEVSILEYQLNWACDRLPHDGVALKHILIRLEIYREQIIEALTEEYASEITLYLDWMITWQKDYIKKSDIQECI
ncbi:hypothetical protein HYG87_00175 [Methanobacterium alkalithermotolerans]|uniref:Uncharacterized protein n=1 Tax=Methanobacterium alkalithermotolerans TaxID=2731220 RepID=A0A8T8KA39_9EURY|nr:hypothetical protein [Methanobacterium alkalithermotolerans]QUH22291.1 hypothetical protein HYG87_00175 [Methanobacterium alkalithermotolerans]